MKQEYGLHKCGKFKSWNLCNHYYLSKAENLGLSQRDVGVA